MAWRIIFVFIFLSGVSIPRSYALDVRVSGSSDDAEEAVRKVSLKSSDLELTAHHGIHQLVGLRFGGVTVPRGATITNAFIQFQVDETNAEDTSLIIQGEASDNALTFKPGVNENISKRPQTTAAVPWFVAPWTSKGVVGPDQRTPDIASIVQEIVDRPGWAPGNSLAIIITGTGHRTAESYDGDQSGAPLLHLDFVCSGLASCNNAPVVDAGLNQVILLSESSPAAVRLLPVSTGSASAVLDGTVLDDGLPNPPGNTITLWSQVSGPATVTFDAVDKDDPTALVSQTGTYVLRLTADDGEFQVSDEVTIAVASSMSTIKVPDDVPTIQEAIDSAVDGDLILVAPGLYREHIVISDKTVTLAASLFRTTDNIADIEQTIIDGNGGGAVITVTPSVGPETEVIGFTIQNGDDGISNRGIVNLSNNRIINNTDGVDNESGRGVFRDNVFANNSDDGIDLDHASAVRIESNVIKDNGNDGIEIRAHDYDGPALETVIRNNVVTNNHGDGIQLIDYPGPSPRIFRIEGNVVEGNGQAGLGIMGDGVSRENFEGASMLERVLVINNTFVRNDHGVTGGDNLIALNNVVVGSTNIGMKNVDGDSIAAFNLFFGNGVDFSDSNVDLQSTKFADPLLNSDQSLGADSPAIDAGTAFFEWNSEVVLDRPLHAFTGAAPDLGALEVELSEGSPPDGSVGAQ